MKASRGSGQLHQQSGIPFQMRDSVAILTLTLLVAFFFRDILLQKAFFWEDFIYQYYPFRNFAAVSLSQGELPLWNPFTLSGMPFQADIQTAVFYIPNLLLTFLVHGERLHFFWVELMIVLHFAVAGITMYYLAREFDLPPPFALFSGIVYALSGFMIVHAIHETFIAEVAWMPLVFLLFRRTLIRRELLPMILGGLVLGLAILGGAPQFTLYILLFLFAFFIYECFITLRTDRKNVVAMIPLAGGFVAIGLAVTAIQLLPTMELAGLSQRAEITYQKSSESSLAWQQILTLIVPRYFGSSGAQGSAYWFAKSYWDYWETCTYVGIAGLLGILGSLRLWKTDRHAPFLIGTVVFALLYALGDNFVFHSFFFHFVPGFDKFRIPGRMAFLFTLSGALLSGAGLRMIFTDFKRHQRLFFSIAGLGIVIWLAAQSGLFQPTGDLRTYEQIHGATVSEATTALILSLAVAGLLLLASRATISLRVAFIGILVVQVADMNLFGFAQNNGQLNPEEYYGRTTQLVNFLKEEGRTEYFRINARQGGAMLLDRNQGMVDRIFMMEGYTPLSLQRLFTPGHNWSELCDMLNAKYRIQVDESRQSMSLGTSSTYLPRAYFSYQAHITADSLVKPFMESDRFDPQKMIVLEEDPGLKVTVPDSSRSWKAVITRYTLNAITLHVETPVNGYLVLSEIYYPGWKAYVDGTRANVYRTNWNLRSLPVEAGTHTVEMRFEPESFGRGLMITIGTLACCGAGLTVLLIRRRSSNSAVVS